MLSTWWIEWSAWWAALEPAAVFLFALPFGVALVGWLADRRPQA